MLLVLIGVMTALVLPNGLGFDSETVRVPSVAGEDIQYRRSRTLWDLLELLIVPAVLGFGVYLFQRIGANRDRARTELESTRDRERAEDERQEAALRGFMDRMGNLLALASSSRRRSGRRQNQFNKLQKTLIRGYVLNSVPSMIPERKKAIINFLYESDMIKSVEPEISLRDADLRSVDLTILRGKEAQFEEINLAESNLGDANFALANMKSAVFTDATLEQANFTGTQLHNAVLFNTDLRQANLVAAQLHNADLRFANLSGANLRGARFNDGTLEDTEKQQLSTLSTVASLLRTIQETSGSFVGFADRHDEIRKSGARSHLNIDKKYLERELEVETERFTRYVEQGTDPQERTDAQNRRVKEILEESRDVSSRIDDFEKWDRERDETGEQLKERVEALTSSIAEKDNQLTRLDGADLSDAVLDGADLESAYLVNVRVRRASFIKAKFINAVLVDMRFSECDLEKADFAGASMIRVFGGNFKNARFPLARISDSNFSTANLEGANFKGAILSNVQFSDEQLKMVNSQGAKWLEQSQEAPDDND